MLAFVITTVFRCRGLHGKNHCLGAILLFFGGCYKNVEGYKVDVTWKTYHNLWDHPINLDSDEEQIIDVPFIKYGSYFSLCFDRERGNPVNIIFLNSR